MSQALIKDNELSSQNEEKADEEMKAASEESPKGTDHDDPVSESVS